MCGPEGVTGTIGDPEQEDENTKQKKSGKGNERSPSAKGGGKTVQEGQKSRGSCLRERGKVELLGQGHLKERLGGIAGLWKFQQKREHREKEGSRVAR